MSDKGSMLNPYGENGKSSLLQSSHRLFRPARTGDIPVLPLQIARLAASIFHYADTGVADLKRYLRAKGIPIRL